MKITLNSRELKKALDLAEKIPDDVWQDTGQVFKSSTPVRTGRAKRNTYTTKTTIQADYPYAGVLDAGRSYRDGQMRGSTQAPEGMSKPALEYLEAELERRLTQAFKG